jgi:hypothetical protein
LYGGVGVGVVEGCADRLMSHAVCVDVLLSRAECRAAALVGVERRLWALGAKAREVYGAAAGGDYWTIDVEAAAGELAVAKLLGVYWSAKDSAAEDREDGDVAGHQVRHSRRLDASLICHVRDSDDQVFVLVVGAMPSFRVAGWLPGVEAKSPAFWREDVPRAAFFVPQSALRPMGEL